MITPSMPWRWIRDRLRPRRAGEFQPARDTYADRYPRIFRFVQSELGAEARATLLSFGCSTGEEVFTLRGYFPNARIKGLDIAPANIAAARRRLDAAPDPALAFAVANSTESEPDEAYDAIFCMAVLRHGGLEDPRISRCDHLIRFEDFARTIADIARCLKPGGLLVIRHSNFRVSDTPAAGLFDTIMRDLLPMKPPRIFDPDNRVVPGLVYPDTVLRKRA